MPHLHQNPSSSIQTTNNDTLFSQKDSMQGQSTSHALSMNYTGTVYRTTAPKFIPAGSIKMQQVKAANSASIKNFNDAGNKRQMNYSNTTGQQNTGGQMHSKRIMRAFGRPKQRHVLHCSSSSDSSSSSEKGSPRNVASAGVTKTGDTAAVEDR